VVNISSVYSLAMNVVLMVQWNSPDILYVVPYNRFTWNQ